MDGLVYDGKFALQNRLGTLIGKQIKSIVLPYRFCFALFCI